MGHQGAGPGQLLGRVLDVHLGAALDPVQDRVLEGRLLELARLREEARRAGKHDGEPLPALFVILDEFSELLSDKPDFIEVFVAIGRLGRSMQIHLLLSSQRLEECRLHGLESHLSYRIGLRTFSAAESRIVPGAADAYDLPPYPGSGYLKSGTREMTRFRACYVAGQPPERVNAALAPAPTGEPRERVVPPGRSVLGAPGPRPDGAATRRGGRRCRRRRRRRRCPGGGVGAERASSGSGHPVRRDDDDGHRRGADGRARHARASDPAASHERQ